MVVTGRGCLSPLGPDRLAFEAALRAGRSAIGPVALPDGPRPLTLRVAARVSGFEAAEHFEARRLPLLDEFSRFALVAAREAVAEAGLEKGELRGAAVVIGTGAGGQAGIDAMLHRAYVQGRRIDPLSVPRVMGSAPVSQIAAELGARGPAFGVTSACASSAHALGIALLLLRSGAAQVALAGGSDACFSYGHLQAWEALRVMAPDTCRPFSRERRGMVLGEGVIPPTANWLGPDPECDLDVTPNIARERPVAAALSSSFAFGGLNAVLALRRLEA